MNRNEVLAALRECPEVSVLIVGAGINGIGTFRDLALNGVDALLVDRGDFCSGASAASSHMAHGGIRYLENGEFSLVREAVRERNFMLEHAPHIVRPLPTTIPIFRLFSGLFNAPLKFLGLLDRPSERGSLVIKVGLMLYDAYTGGQRTVPRHRFMNREEALRRWEKLNPAIVHTATYYDGAILQPERLGLELVLDAEAANPGCRALNYVSLHRGVGESVFLHDELNGDEYETRPRLLINATGPWIDATNRAFGETTKFIGGTKGSHVVLLHPELRAAIGDHEFFFENEDGRIVLIFPLFDKVLVGTSDVAVDDPDAVRCTDEEVDYFLELVKRVFPTIRVDRSHIVFRFSGVRPLAASRSKSTGQITRNHEIQVLEAAGSGLGMPVYSLVGGKWTSWRAFSEQVTDRCLGYLGLARRINTKRLSIGGGRDYPATPEDRERCLAAVADAGGGQKERARELFEQFGTRSMDAARFIAAGEDKPLRALSNYSRREIGFIAVQEKVVHLEDLLLRRTKLAMLGQLSLEAVREIADSLAIFLDWSEERKEAEIARARDVLKERHQVQL
jgi:glycerol-3-phosphate dehydrogenase